MGKSILKRRRKPSENAFAAGTLQLADLLRRDPQGQQTDNRMEQSSHYKGILYIAIRSIMDCVYSATVQINKKHRRYARVSLRRLEKSLDRLRASDPRSIALIEKALPTPHANTEDEQFRPFDDPDHSLCKLIDQPNRTETFNELLAQLVLQYNLTGSALLWANPNHLGVPGELYVLPTALCWPQPPTVDYPEGWWRVTQYYPSGGYGLLPSAIAGGGAPVDARDIFVFKNPHPLWRWDAYSPLTACATQLDVLESIDISRWAAMDRGITPDMVLLAPGVQQAQLDAYLERLKQTNIGKFRHRGIMAIGGDQYDSKYDIKFPSQTAKDMDYGSGWDQMVAFALAAFGVPKSVASLANTGSYAELYAALKQFHTLTMRPLAARMGAWLTRKLARIWGRDFAIELDLPTIDDQQLQEQQLSTDLAHDGLTYNEYRATRGRKPVPGGDVIVSVYVQAQQAKAQQQQQATAPQPPAAEPSSPNGPPASPTGGGEEAAPQQPAPQSEQQSAPAPQGGDELANFLGHPQPGSDEGHIQNSVADAALQSLGVPQSSSPNGTQEKGYTPAYLKASGYPGTKKPPFPRTAKPVTQKVAAPAGENTRSPAASDSLPKSQETNRDPGELYPASTTGAPRQQTAADTSAPAPQPKPAPNPFNPPAGPPKPKAPPGSGQATSVTAGEKQTIQNSVEPPTSPPVPPPTKPGTVASTSPTDATPNNPNRVAINRQTGRPIANRPTPPTPATPAESTTNTRTPLGEKELPGATSDEHLAADDLPTARGVAMPTRESDLAQSQARAKAVIKDPAKWFYTLPRGRLNEVRDVMSRAMRGEDVQAPAWMHPDEAYVMKWLTEKEARNQNIHPSKLGEITSSPVPQQATPAQPQQATGQQPTPQQPVPQQPQLPPNFDYDAAAEAIRGGHNVVYRYTTSFPNPGTRHEIRTGADLKQYLDSGGTLSDEDAMRAGVAKPSATPADAVPTVQPIASKEEIATLANAGQLPPAEHFAEAAKSVPVQTPEHAQVLRNVASWVGNYAEKHADAVAQHFKIDPQQAFRLLVHAMTAIAHHAANNLATTGNPESANINATLTHTPTGRTANIKFHPRTIAARQAINDIVDHLRGGNELTEQQAAEATEHLNHLPQDEVEQLANSLERSRTVGQHRAMSRAAKWAETAAAEQPAEEGTLGKESPAAAPSDEQIANQALAQPSSPNAPSDEEIANSALRQRPVSAPIAAGFQDINAAPRGPTNEELAASEPGAHLHPNVQVRRINGKDWVVKGRNGKSRAVQNEVATSTLARSIGLDVPQVHAVKLHGQDAAAVEHVPGRALSRMTPDERRAAIASVPREELDKHALFDYLIGSSDPNNGNYLISSDGKLVAIDKEASLRNGDVGDRAHFNIPFFLEDAQPPNTPAGQYQFSPESLAHMAEAGREMADTLTQMNRPADARGVLRRAQVLANLARAGKPVTATQLDHAGAAFDKTSPPPNFLRRVASSVRNFLNPSVAPATFSPNEHHRSPIGPVFTRNPDTGLIDSARVGVPAMSVPEKASEIPRLPNLSKKQKKVETRFADAYEANPDGMADKYLKALAERKVGVEPNVFATDDVKMLNRDWNPGKVKAGEPLDKDTSKAMAKYNTAVHGTANAIAKRAFLKYLDRTVQHLPPDKRTVLITNGGCAGGKGSSLARANDQSSPYHGKIPVASQVGAVWDAAGEQNATENEWIWRECKKRGITPVFAYVWADPKDTWEAKDRGVVRRAMRKGRMVDARLFADSYAEGAKNMHAFWEKHKDDGTKFVFLDNRKKGDPKVLPTFPKETLQWNAEQIYHMAVESLKKHAKKGTLPKALLKGGLAGTKIWGKPRPTS